MVSVYRAFSSDQALLSQLVTESLRWGVRTLNEASEQDFPREDERLAPYLVLYLQFPIYHFRSFHMENCPFQ